jgi:hypothetical protein
MTTVTVCPDGPQTGLGTRFTGRTHLGPIGFDDPMEVTGWQLPSEGQDGWCRVAKQGAWLTGWAEIVVSAQPVGSRVVWTEEVAVRGVPRFAHRLLARIGTQLFSRALRQLSAELTWRQ